MAGFVAAHRPFLSQQAAHVQGFDLTISRELTGYDSPFSVVYGRPRFGLSIGYLDLGKDVNGKAVGVIPHFNFPVLRSSRVGLWVQGGTGFGFFTNPFDLVTNPKNLMIGSRVALNMRLRCLFSYRFATRWEALASLGLTHFSNGNIGLPNYGINIPIIQLGLGYRVPTPAGKPWVGALPVLPRHWVAQAHVSMASKQINDSWPRHFLAGTLGLTAGRRLGYKSTLGAGIDVFYDPSNEAGRADTLTARDIPPGKALAVALKAGHELHMGPVRLLTYVGGYVYKPTDAHGWVYQRLAVQYHFPFGLLVGFGLKTHLAIADFIEWTLGYEFARPPNNRQTP